MHVNEPRPEPALSPDEAHAWRTIERALRDELPVARIERRARLRTDRAVVVGGVAVVVGGTVALLAAFAPVTLTLAGTLVAGLGFGTITCRALFAALATRRPALLRRGAAMRARFRRH